jgi:hypothetical protein
MAIPGEAKTLGPRRFRPSGERLGLRPALTAAVASLPTDPELLPLLARLGVKAFARHLGVSESTLRQEFRSG